ncbi:MAG: 50S ribosomal protein L7/L12 [Candidatus Parcubacteria bacterium]|nr:50S ribosomal protein L7/L12 [Candidatus Paceibacterota bacterium]
MMSKINQIIDELKTLSLLEASELVKAIEETFNVSAAAPTAAAAAPTAAAAVVEEATEFDVVVESVPADKKIAIIKIVKEKKAIGLGEAKTMVESAPFTIAEKLNKADATALKDELSGAGASVTLK